MLLLPYSVNIQALSASTANFINGSQPYLTFDGGVTKATTTEDLLGITLSDGTRITPATNTSSKENPIELPNLDASFTDINMLVPPTTDHIALSELIGAPNNYWGDDDGDGQGINGIKVTGSLSVNITDNDDQTVGRDIKLNICKAPYKVVLTGTDGSLTTQYGTPNERTFKSSSATYYINPKASPVICHARPILEYGGGSYAGPADIWSPNNGFLIQSTSPSSYDLNFPTTGANNLYFDLMVGGSGPLTWPSVTLGGITATMTPNASGNSVRVTLTGTTDANKPDLPQTFELIGYDSGGRAALKYGFVLKQWFIGAGNRNTSYYTLNSWCRGMGYRLPLVKELTNSTTRGAHYQRRIGAGFFTEWGNIELYYDANFAKRHGQTNLYWTSETTSVWYYTVYGVDGSLDQYTPYFNHTATCVYP
ncbi:hypothetical protein [Gilliamella sp. wkB112]|uniref:hypothetical protein n=1 Tax=Gilliamella sp. wkB112 TaxID=3120257 RepID=UPI00080DC2B8|nr:hypothetical protein [Gilliamella apicola]OCG03054.1 hypothetical protein A9G12_09040 [Gilliamella apicola]